MPKSLDREERLQLMKFITSFAWADLEVKVSERSFIKRLMKRLELPEDERELVEGWLEVPPPPEEIDPTDIPREHRELFVTAIRGMILADGAIDDAEAENFELLELLLGE